MTVALRFGTGESSKLNALFLAIQGQFIVSVCMLLFWSLLEVILISKSGPFESRLSKMPQKFRPKTLMRRNKN